MFLFWRSEDDGETTEPTDDDVDALSEPPQTVEREELPKPVRRYHPAPTPQAPTLKQNLEQNLKEVQALSVTWHQVEQGLHFKIVTTGTTVIRKITVFVLDLEWWMEKRKQFVQVKELHQGKGFERLQIGQVAELFPETPEVVSFLHTELGKLWCHGRSENSVSDTRTIRSPGIWRVQMRYEAFNNNFQIPNEGINRTLYVSWPSTDSRPEPCEDPSPARARPSRPPPPITPVRG